MNFNKNKYKFNNLLRKFKNDTNRRIENKLR